VIGILWQREKGWYTSFTTERMLLASLSTSEKTSVLLSAVATQIRANSQAFHEFISALNEDISMQFLAWKE